MNNSQNMKKTKPNKYLFAYVSRPFGSFLLLLRPIPHLEQSWPSKIFGQDLFGLSFITFLAGTFWALSLFFFLSGFGFFHFKPTLLFFLSISVVNDNIKLLQLRMFCTSIRATLAPS